MGKKHEKVQCKKCGKSSSVPEWAGCKYCGVGPGERVKGVKGPVWAPMGW